MELHQLEKICARFRERADGIESWLRDIDSRCRDEQLRNVEGTRERAYWHYGYTIALNDVRDLLRCASNGNNEHD
ncbi:MAG TPA: hypothetical protein VEF03_11290 [Candidatus Binataceae bacterium]|nr:hypothetical protein [Candidatus Binataceae bacterium]